MATNVLKRLQQIEKAIEALNPKIQTFIRVRPWWKGGGESIEEARARAIREGRYHPELHDAVFLVSPPKGAGRQGLGLPQRAFPPASQIPAPLHHEPGPEPPRPAKAEPPRRQPIRYPDLGIV